MFLFFKEFYFEAIYSKQFLPYFIHANVWNYNTYC